MPLRHNLNFDDLVTYIREFMRDHPELNRLIKGEETTDRQIKWAILDTLDDFNTTPPFTRTTLENFPSRKLLKDGVVIEILKSAGLLQSRNQLNYSDGGINVAIFDKTPLYQSWINLYYQDYENKKQRIKIALNIEAAFNQGGVHSEYWWINGVWGNF